MSSHYIINQPCLFTGSSGHIYNTNYNDVRFQICNFNSGTKTTALNTLFWLTRALTVLSIISAYR